MPPARADEAERGLQRALTVLPPDGAVWIAWEKDPPDPGNGLDEENRDDWEGIRPEPPVRE